MSVPFVPETAFSHAKSTQNDEIWDSIDFDTSLVALPNKWVESKQLPVSARFPWDNSKSIYLFNAYHDLHCVM